MVQEWRKWSAPAYSSWSIQWGIMGFSPWSDDLMFPQASSFPASDHWLARTKPVKFILMKTTTMKEDQERRGIFPDLIHPMTFSILPFSPFVDYLLNLFFSFVSCVHHCCQIPLEQKKGPIFLFLWRTTVNLSSFFFFYFHVYQTSQGKKGIDGICTLYIQLCNMEVLPIHGY